VRTLIVYLGIVLDDEARNLIGQGKELKDAQDAPRKEDIVQE
jgi:LETM1 and EF-hand domain-containing protein 1